MIPLEQHTTTLGTSRRLEELQVPQESLFYWRVGGAFGEPQTTVLVPESDMYVLKTANGAYNYISAFTASEVGVYLPSEFVSSEDGRYVLGIQKHGNNYEVGYRCVKNPDYFYRTFDNSLSEAMGLMLIYLLENKIVSIEDLKGK